MSRVPGTRALLLMALAFSSAMAQDPTGERQRIESERRQFEARFATEDAACRQRFEVTRCVDEVKARRRAALGGLRQEELLIADAERRKRAAARMQAIEANRIDAESRPPAPPQPAPVQRHPLSAGTPAASHEARRHDAHEAAAAAAAQRASAASTRRAAAAEDRSRIAEREAGRASESKKSAPLPLPPDVAASARPL
jgi:hypothetical protein